MRTKIRLVLLLPMVLLIAGSVAPAGERLYNGIVLPDQWPPWIERLSDEPMPVPYLESPPELIPIDVGRQLLVDDFLIEQTTLKRTFHKAEYYKDNPVVKPDKRWETQGHHTAMAFSDGVFYDPADKLFKMWYMGGYMNTTCLALSDDGMNWRKPAFDVQPGTNIVCLSGQRDSSTVWLDLLEKDPARRYKMFQFQRDPWLGSMHFSADGVHWSEPKWCGPSGDRSTFFYNPFRGVWVFGLRAVKNQGPWNYKTPPYNPIGRCRRYWESKDFATLCNWEGGRRWDQWKPGQPGYWVGADRLDQPRADVKDIKPELYNLDAVAYESLMLGLFSVWRHHPAGRPKINDICLGFSRDGFHWHRPFREAVIPVSEKPDAWNWANVQSVGGGCLVVGDKLYFYASGRNSTGDHTGLAFMRRDGFASMDAAAEPGQLTTRPISFRGKHLFVNADCDGGRLEAEVLDQAGNPVAPFTRQNCKPISADATLLPVAWNGAAGLSALSGKPVRLRFHLTSGSLYSFWVSPDDSGASHGYVAAGGPGFTGLTDTVGRGSAKR